jgi:hypothetical protein
MEIKLTQGYVAIIDDEDYHLIKNYNWRVRISPKINIKYATATMRTGNGTHKIISMHRVILGLTDPHVFTDHKDHDGLNNSRSNLRTCTRTQNNQNRRAAKNSSSQYLGVCKNRKKWTAVINKKYLGLFENEEEAAKAYDNEAIKLFGEFANLNFQIKETSSF